LARKLLIEKVKKEPDTELLISPALKEKILIKEGVDLRQINDEYQEKKGSSKVKQESKISNQEPGEDSKIDENEIINVNLFGLKEKQESKIYIQEPGEDTDIDVDEIINVDLSDQLKREWNKFKWYSMPSIAKKLGKHRKTVIYWRDFGIKINGVHIRLKMIKRPFRWYAKGKWLIEFFLKTNANLDMDET
jgi:hypothetical protein